MGPVKGTYTWQYTSLRSDRQKMPAARFETAFPTSERPPRLRARGHRDGQWDVLQLWNWKSIAHEAANCLNPPIFKL